MADCPIHKKPLLLFHCEKEYTKEIRVQNYSWKTGVGYCYDCGNHKPINEVSLV